MMMMLRLCARATYYYINILIVGSSVYVQNKNWLYIR